MYIYKNKADNIDMTHTANKFISKNERTFSRNKMMAILKSYNIPSYVVKTLYTVFLSS